jgi:hypothetical protein
MVLNAVDRAMKGLPHPNKNACCLALMAPPDCGAGRPLSSNAVCETRTIGGPVARGGSYIPRSFTCLALIVMLFAAGCASQAEFLNNNQGMATQTAVSRAQFEMNRQQVTPVIISREVVQPALQGPWMNGIQRAEYTIGVSGCGRRTIFVVICPEYGDGCFAAGPGRFHDWQ